MVSPSDFPYEPGAVFLRAVECVEAAKVAPGDVKQILEANAEALFG